MNQRRPQTSAKQELSTPLSNRHDLLSFYDPPRLTRPFPNLKPALTIYHPTGIEVPTGRRHPDTLISVSNLGNVLSMQGKYKEAEALHRQAFETREKVLGWEHSDMFNSIGNLSDVLSRQGKYEEAEAMHQRALEALEKVWGCEHPDTLTIVNSLGNVLTIQGKYKEAEAMPR